MEESFLLNYISDITDVANKAKQIERINKKLAERLGKDLTTSIDLINRKLSSVQFDKVFKIKGENGETQKVIGNLEKLTTEFRTADGALFQFNETQRNVNGEITTLSSSMTAVNEKADKMIGKFSQLGTNFKNVGQVNENFKNDLKEFGNVTEIVSSQLVKSKDGIKQYDTIAKTTNGTYVKLTETFKRTSEGIQSVSRSVIAAKTPVQQLNNLVSQLPTNFENLTDVNKQFEGQLKNLGNVSKFFGTTLSQLTDTGSRTTKVFETTAGKFVALTEVTKKLPNGLVEVTRTTKEMNKAQLANITTMENGKIVTRTFADNIGTLLKRAALTIPIWFAIRQGISSIFGTIRDGLKSIIEFEKALKKIERNLQGTGSEIAASLGLAREEIIKLSLQTGKSTTEIATAVKQFATIGFDIKDSLALATTATKASVLLFEDAGETAEAFARSFKVLQDTSKGAKGTQDQFNDAIALTVKLGENNADNLKEINEALLKSASSAKTVGLSFNQLIVLLNTLATAGRTGSQAGTLLSSSLNELLPNLSKLSTELGVSVEKGDDTFKILGKVLEASEKLANSTLISDRARIVSAFADIFGGERGTKIISSLTAVNKLFKENSKVLPDVEGFNKKFDKLTESIPIQVDRFKALNTEIQRSFVNGIVGGDTFAQSLEKINNLLEKAIKSAEFFGKVIGGKFSFTAGDPILQFISDSFTTDLQKNLAAASQAGNTVGKDIAKNIIKGFKGELDVNQLTDLINTIDVFGASNAGFTDQASLDRAKEQLKIQLDIAKAKESQLTATKKQETSDEINKDVNKSILTHILEQSKARGFVESQLIKQEFAIRKQLQLELRGTELLDKKLQLQRALNEEQRLNADLSSDATKLFNIAKTEGVGIAKNISEVLSGQKDFNNFVRKGGQDLEVFKREFGDIFEAEQAKAFFRGERVPGQENLRGGSRITLPLEDQGRIDETVKIFDPMVSVLQEQAKTLLLNRDTSVLNTSSLQANTLALEALRSALLVDSPNLINGIPVNRVNSSGVTPTRQVVDINLNIDGKNFKTSGSPEEARALAKVLLNDPASLKALEDQLASSLSNPNSKLGKQDRDNINNF